MELTEIVPLLFLGEIIVILGLYRWILRDWIVNKWEEKLKELFTLVKVEASEAADTIIETVTDPLQITGHSEKQKFLSDWSACRTKYPEGTWFRASRVSACMLAKGWTSEIIGEGLEAALRKL